MASQNRLLIENAEGEEWKAGNKESPIRLVYGYDMIFFTGADKAATFEVVPPVE